MTCVLGFTSSPESLPAAHRQRSVNNKYRKENMKSPDEICGEYFEKKVSLTVKHMDENYILIEGDTDSLEFLGKLIIAQANFDEDCGFQIAPRGAGDAHFSKKAELGVYIHRLPCEHDKINHS